MTIIPSGPLPDKETSPIMTKPRSQSEDTWTDPDIYVNVKVSEYFLNYHVLFIITLSQHKYSLVKNLLQKHLVEIQHRWS